MGPFLSLSSAPEASLLLEYYRRIVGKAKLGHAANQRRRLGGWPVLAIFSYLRCRKDRGGRDVDSRLLRRPRPLQCLPVFLGASHQVALVPLLRKIHELLLINGLVFVFVVLDPRRLPGRVVT